MLWMVNQKFEQELFGDFDPPNAGESIQKAINAQPIGEAASRLSGLCFVAHDDILDPVPFEENWQDNANCLGVDPDLFFPERGASTREAKEVCRGCCVREQCLEYALENGDKFGIWGGLSERERRRIRRQRAQAARSALS